jgi:hypothetical protein
LFLLIAYECRVIFQKQLWFNKKFKLIILIHCEILVKFL